MKKNILTAFFVLTAHILCFSERLHIQNLPEAVVVDFPARTKLVDSKDGKTFQFWNEIFPVNIAVKIIDAKDKSTNEELKNLLEKLSVEPEISDVAWCGEAASVGFFEGSIGGKDSTGYSGCAKIPETDKMIAVIAWTGQENKDKCSIFMCSVVDSIYVSTESFYSCGLMQTFLYPVKNSPKNINLEIGKIKIHTEMDEGDIEASEDFIEREYKILEAAAFLPKNEMHEAWQRYYRMIFKDSSERLRTAINDIQEKLSPDCTDETDFAQRLLTWTQDFPFARQKTSSDFICLPKVLTNRESDCDSRSMLLCTILENLGIDCSFFVSYVHHHALAGITSNHPGFSFTAENKQYLIGETTAKGCTWGKINAKQQNQADWVVVSLP